MNDMSGQPLVSVVMPVYNSEKYLREAIDSILSQTYENIELIVVDDGSDNEETHRILHSYGNRIKCFFRHNSGVAATLNYGIKQAKGMYIARMDSDDISEKDRILKEVGVLKDNPDISLVCSRVISIDENGDKMDWQLFCPTDLEIIKSEMIFTNPIVHPTVMFRKTLIDEGFFYDENQKAEDYDLWSRMISSGVRLFVIPEQLLKYRFHLGNNTRQHFLEVVSSSENISSNYISNMWNINMNEYFEFDTCQSNISWVPETCDIGKFIGRQLKLLRTIAISNMENNVIDEKSLLFVLTNRLKWSLSLIGDIDLLDVVSSKKIGLIDWEQDYCTGATAFIKFCDLLMGYQWDSLSRNIHDFWAANYNYAIFGVGKIGLNFLDNIEEYRKSGFKWNLIELCDNSEKCVVFEGKQYKTIKCKDVIDKGIDYILISSKKYYSEIANELVLYGFDKDRILRCDFLVNNLSFWNNHFSCSYAQNEI